jgi:phosphoglycolate phosphatase-like HAD superfamily hydrolase
VLFDLDGTLIDSDAALLEPFARLGVTDVPPLGLPLGAACDLAGITTEAYLEHYDSTASQPFAGVDDLLGQLPRWGLCSNKERGSGQRELERLGWTPTVAFFSDDFGGLPKVLDPVLLALELVPADALFVGDTAHDRACAHLVGVEFALAGWNPRTQAEPGDTVLRAPADLLALI